MSEGNRYGHADQIQEADYISVPQSSGSNIELSNLEHDDAEHNFDSVKSIWSVPDFDIIPTVNQTQKDIGHKNSIQRIPTELLYESYDNKNVHNDGKRVELAYDVVNKFANKFDNVAINNFEHRVPDNLKLQAFEPNNFEYQVPGNFEYQVPGNLKHQAFEPENFEYQRPENFEHHQVPENFERKQALFQKHEKLEEKQVPENIITNNFEDPVFEIIKPRQTHKKSKVPPQNIPGEFFEKSALGFKDRGGCVKCLTVGRDNKCDLDGCLVTGSNNTITHQDDNYEQCFSISSSSIIGGNNNFINNNNKCGSSSALISCSGVRVQDCENCVFLGLSNVREPIKNLKNTTLINKLKIGVGSSNDALLEVSGSVHVEKDFNIDGNINSTSSTISTLIANNATIQNLNVANISSKAEYIVSTDANELTKVIHKGDGISTIYANSILYPVFVQLGAPEDPTFEANRSIFIKDASLIYGDGSRNDIYISVPSGVKIEIYQGCNILSSEAGTYVITSSGGAVTFRYMSADPNIPNMLPTWVIESQLIGNARII